VSNHHSQSWNKVIILVDMNCFFAAVEQQDNPFWRNRPIAVTNGIQGTTIITSSYEARNYGVKTGMRLKEARQLCPDIIQAPSRPYRYAEVSTKIMSSLQQITPDVEVYSVDEAFLDMTHCQSLLGSPLTIGELVKKVVSDVSGLTCSIGVSGDKTTAKYAAKLHKPDGLTLIHPDDAEAVLAPLPVTALSGINTGTARFLAQYGVFKCGDMKQIPISIPAKRFGNSILIYFQHMSEKVAARLRQHQYKASEFYIGLKTKQGWLQTNAKLTFATDDGKVIFDLCRQFTKQNRASQGIWQVQITALNPQSEQQIDLFTDASINNKQNQLNMTVDQINQRYGEFTIAPSRLLNRSEMPNVIAPAWKPFGHRKTI